MVNSLQFWMKVTDSGVEKRKKWDICCSKVHTVSEREVETFIKIFDI